MSCSSGVRRCATHTSLSAPPEHCGTSCHTRRRNITERGRSPGLLHRSRLSIQFSWPGKESPSPKIQSDLQTLLMSQNVQHVAVWVLHKEASDTPSLIRKRLRNLSTYLSRHRIDRNHSVNVD